MICVTADSFVGTVTGVLMWVTVVSSVGTVTGILIVLLLIAQFVQ